MNRLLLHKVWVQHLVQLIVDLNLDLDYPTHHRLFPLNRLRTIVVAVQPVRPEAVSVGIPAYRLSTTGTFASTPRLSPTTMNQPWYKEYRRVSMYTQMNDLSVAEIDEDDRQMNCIEKLLSCPRLICTYMCCRCCNKLMFVFWHRLLHEHDIFELFFVNNRLYTRTHRTMVLLTRIGGKFAGK